MAAEIKEVVADANFRDFEHLLPNLSQLLFERCFRCCYLSGRLEPLLGWRHVRVTERRTAVDFAEVLRWVVEELHPDATRVVLVTDNLNVHDPGSLYAWGERGDAVYFNNPVAYVRNLRGDHLDWLRSRVSVLLICGQGQWEDTTGALESTKRFAGLLAEKGIPHELDLWGHDVPHDWPSWRAQISHHLHRFV